MKNLKYTVTHEKVECIGNDTSTLVIDTYRIYLTKSVTSTVSYQIIPEVEKSADTWKIEYIRVETGGEITSLLDTSCHQDSCRKKSDRRKRNSSSSRSSKKRRKKAAGDIQRAAADHVEPAAVLADVSVAVVGRQLRSQRLNTANIMPPSEDLLLSPPKLTIIPKSTAARQPTTAAVQAAASFSPAVSSARQLPSHHVDWSRALRIEQPTEHYAAVLEQLLSEGRSSSSCVTPLQDSWGLEASSCPGCGDSFLLPTTFFQHLYRRSVRISFECRDCRKYLEFSNKCLFRIHLLSHWELGDGEPGGGLETNLLELTSLELSELTGGGRNSISSSFLNHRRTLSQLAKSEADAQCMECLTVLCSQLELQHHLQPLVISNLDHLRCEECTRVAASPCSLSAHRRIHGKRPPYVCPECGQEYLTWTTFKMHLARSCLHDARVPLHACPLCKTTSADAALLFPCSNPPAAALLDHLMEQHLRMAWKCGRCARAFTAKDRMRAHARLSHRGQRTPYYRLYRPPLLLKNHRRNPTLPGGLFFKSREGLRSFLATDLELPVVFGYACNGCTQNYFQRAEQLVAHAEQCGHSFTTDGLYAERPLDDRYLEAMDDLRRMSGEGGLVRCRGCLKHCRNFRNHICKHHSRMKDEEEGDLTAASKDPSGRSEPSCQPTVAVASLFEVRDRLKRDDARKRQDLLKKVKAKKQVFAEDQCIPRAPPETSPLKLTIKLGSCTADKKVTAAAADRRNTADPLAAVVVKPAVGQPSSSLGSVSGKVVPTGINY